MAPGTSASHHVARASPSRAAAVSPSPSEASKAVRAVPQSPERSASQPEPDSFGAREPMTRASCPARPAVATARRYRDAQAPGRERVITHRNEPSSARSRAEEPNPKREDS